MYFIIVLLTLFFNYHICIGIPGHWSLMFLFLRLNIIIIYIRAIYTSLVLISLLFNILSFCVVTSSTDSHQLVT